MLLCLKVHFQHWRLGRDIHEAYRKSSYSEIGGILLAVANGRYLSCPSQYEPPKGSTEVVIDPGIIRLDVKEGRKDSREAILPINLLEMDPDLLQNNPETVGQTKIT